MDIFVGHLLSGFSLEIGNFSSVSSQAKIYWAIIVVALAIGVLISQYITVRQVDVQQHSYNTNAGEIVHDVLVGQTFTATADNLSAISVMFATYSGRGSTEPIEFHLRSSIEDQQDIRTTTVAAPALGDNQLYRFEFEPIPNSKGRQYFFYVTSPTSVFGNAVTVDLSTVDPYPLGSAYVVRGQGADVTNPQVLKRSGKQTSDLAFETYYSVPLRKAIVTRTSNRVSTFISTWDESVHNYLIWLKVSWPALVFLFVIAIAHKKLFKKLGSAVGKRESVFILLTILFVIAVVVRLMYAQTLPLTNDEGNYLYDARALREGSLAGGDGYVKAPLVIAWISVWQLFLGDTIFAGRLSSIVIGALTMIPLYYLARDLWGKRFGIIVAAIWATFGSAAVFNIYIHTQPVALFFGISGLAVLLMALRGTTPKIGSLAFWEPPSSFWWFIVSGVLLGLGVASRKSILALGLVPILLILLEGRNWKLRVGHFLSVGIGFVLVIAVFLGLAAQLYGTEGFWEALGVNSAEDSIVTVDPAEHEQVRAYSLRGMTPFFRESLPLILLSVLGLGFVLERLFHASLRGPRTRSGGRSNPVARYFVSKLGWIASWAVFVWAWSFFSEYEGSAFMRYGIRRLWMLFAVILAVFTLMPTMLSLRGHRTRSGGRSRPQGVPSKARELIAIQQDPSLRSGRRFAPDRHARPESLARDDVIVVKRLVTAALIVPLWIGGLVFFYMNWIKFHANYISEFIPPLVLLSSFGLLVLSGWLHKTVLPIPKILKRAVALGVLVIVLWAVVVSNYITFLFEHTGTFDQRAVKEAAHWARENIPLNEPIFTGAALVPYLSGHHTALDIAHPRWYAYEFTRKDPERLNTFLPPAEQMLQAFRDANWFLHEKQTGFSFLMEYSEIEAGLVSDFEQVKGIENGSNTLTFYRRIR